MLNDVEMQILFSDLLSIRSDLLSLSLRSTIMVEEGIMLNVAGGLMLEHPLTLRFVDTMVGTTDFVMGLPKSLTEKLIQAAF
ncbi:hypothetical protein ACSBR1_005923 [Camellia fascicularis]